MMVMDPRFVMEPVGIILVVIGLCAIWVCVKKGWYKQLVGTTLFIGGVGLLVACLYPLLGGDTAPRNHAWWRHVWGGFGVVVALLGVWIFRGRKVKG